MPASQARVPTDRAGRYLTQLCEHISRLTALGHGHDEGGAASMPRRAEWSDTDGIIDFGWGRCTLHTTGDALVLHAEAEAQPQLRRIEDSISARLEQIGRRGGLTVTWRPAPSDAAGIIDALLAPEGRADPFPLYAQAHTIGPVSAITGNSFLACGYAAVNQVLRDSGFGMADSARPRPEDPDQLVDHSLPSMSRSILRANPPDHGRMRSLMTQVFTPRRVAALQPAIENAVDHLLDHLAETGADGRPIDFMDRFAFPLPVTVICELLGVAPADRHRFRPLAADLTEILELSAAASGLGPADAAARELAAYFAHLVGERRAAPDDDLVSALVAARDADDGRLSDEELLANLILLLVAGFETTTNLLGNGLAIVLDRPGLHTALRAGRIPISGFIEEVLRYDSPVQVTTRRARADDLAIGDISIPRGSEVILLVGAANRDPDRYHDPDRFDPTRTDVKPLSFGAGPHICIGNSLARLEATVAFSRLVARFPALTAAADQQPTRRDRLVLRGYQTLPVQVTSGQAGC